MITIEASKRRLKIFLFASQQFWLCNTIGWLAFAVAQSLRNSFDGSQLTVNFLHYIPTSILGMLCGLCVHYFYNKFQWFKRHPIRLVPIACIISIGFGGINASINLHDLVVSIPEICSRDFTRPPYSCGAISDLFLQSMGVMLIWCLIYFLIQAERRSHQECGFNTAHAICALISVVALNHLGTLLSVVAYIDWGDTHYLFSKAYFVNSISFIFPIFFASYIVFIKPKQILVGSQTLPLIPMLIVLSFSFSIFNRDAGAAFSRLYYLQTYDDASFISRLYYILFGNSYGNFGSAGQLAGTLEGGFTNGFSIMLLFFCFRYSPHSDRQLRAQPTNFNFKRMLSQSSYAFLFWLSFGLLIYRSDIMDLSYFGKSVPFVSTISFAIVGLFLGTWLRLKILYFSSENTTTIVLVFKIVCASIFTGWLLSGSLWLINYTYIFVILDRYNIETYSSFVNIDNSVFAHLLVSCVLCGLWSFICYMIESLNFQRDITIKQLRLEKNMQEIQLNALAGKIDPHFVFNALNNIRTLVDEDGEKARSAIVALSDILRSPITSNSQDKITVVEEMLLVRNYIALSKIQLEDRLTYQDDVSDDASKALVPSMLLQIIVENAIKHGISQLPNGGVLSLKIRTKGQQLICTIANHGSLQANTQTVGFGVGIRSIHERLALLYSSRASFSLQEVNDTVVAELILPFENTL